MPFRRILCLCGVAASLAALGATPVRAEPNDRASQLQDLEIVRTQYLPKDMGIVVWYFEKRRESLDFFSSRGFRTVAGAYYDGDDLENPQGWLEAMDSTPKAAGIMYTTWSSNYKLLAPFGDLVSKRAERPGEGASVRESGPASCSGR